MTIQRALEIIKNEMPYESGVINEALNMVGNAVEKQIPKKPINLKDNFYNFHLVCPSCKNSISDVRDTNHCHHCGQTLDWSEILDWGENNG